MKKQFGFTLIEVMVVITIIAILATAGLSAYTGYIKKSIDVKTLAYVTAWNSAIVQLKADSPNGATPTADAINTYLALHPVSSRTHIASLVEAFSNI
jgi:prepilin-type N-terminal cleavage/methylation domain-containing protein